MIDSSLEYRRKKPSMVKQHAILIVGGYGIVGQRLAADLAPDYPGRIIVAGRRVDRATQFAAILGHGVRGRQIDVNDLVSVEAALDGVSLVVSCIDQSEPHLLHAAIAHGLAYTDITPHLMQRRPTEAMKSSAAHNRARILLGAGLAPGISSMFARLGADRVGEVVRVESNVLLSIGDVFGPASRSYIMDEIALPYTVVMNGHMQATRPFSAAARVTFPPPLGRRMTYLFPFSDQVFFHETLGARTALARLALDPPWLGRALSTLVRLGVPALMRRRVDTRERFNRLVGWLQQRYAGHDWYSLVVEVQGTGGTTRVSMTGHGQADATASGAAALVRALYEGEVEQPGIWLAEQIVPLGPFLARLTKRGLVPLIEVAPVPQPVG
jgi:saccharopine dehydrogenase (NAD+, L-lysine forming)